MDHNLLSLNVFQ